MKSLLNKRLPGILALGLVTLAVGAAGVPAGAAASDTGDAQISGSLTKKQKKQKNKALKKCNKKKGNNKKATKKKKKKCKKQVNKKYNKIAKNNPPPIGATKTVNLGDNYFTPNDPTVKVNDAIVWSWANVGGFEPHNVTMTTGPSGVSRNGFTSGTTAETSTRFKRQFTKAGTYNFVCSLHFEMTMTVKVTK